LAKPFLILQLRPETRASDDEFRAILEKGGLNADRTHRIRLDRSPIPGSRRLDDYAGIIVGGGPGCVSTAPEDKSAKERRIETGVMSLMPEITDRDFPFLGCCYGIGILGRYLGATVSKSRFGEPVGTSDCRLTAEGARDPLLSGIRPEFQAFVGHKEALQDLPENCVHLVSSVPCPYQMIRHGRNVYATQFHPEADAASFEVRINIYRHEGYFPPEDAERLVAMCRRANVNMPERILRNFVQRYG